jgi:hypothetical protein
MKQEETRCRRCQRRHLALALLLEGLASKAATRRLCACMGCPCDPLSARDGWGDAPPASAKLPPTCSWLTCPYLAS